MPPFPWFDLIIILVLVLVNGVFAMSELAIVSARTARLAALAEKGNSGAAKAIELAANPGRFLSTVQVGITLIGIIAGAYSGASLGGPVAARLEPLGVPADLAQTLGFALVIGFTTYASLVIGELVPKQIALRSAERIAVVMAIPMDLLARIAAPLVWVLDMTSAMIFRLLGLRRTADDLVTAEELQMVFAEATKSGVIEEQERAIISGVVRLADRPVREVMTPRTEVDWIDVDADSDAISALLERSQHSLWPVAEGTIDEIIGVVKVRELLRSLVQNEQPDIRALMRPSAIIPDQVDAMDAIGVLQQADVAMAMVHDEYGHFDGIVTPADLLSALAGNFVSDQEDGDLPAILERDDGSLLISGALPADALAERIGLRFDETRDFATVAGYALAILRHLPEEGEQFEDQGWRFEIVDMDGRKIDKLIARQVADAKEAVESD
ncbi:hemolysin family protein [Alterisphingorhabdus coralli]|uniref:Hemolysin family protein n=1 Tax=Alterisphingorhabdus coralli TaxID=3071408 RepID=A0AA97F759_9SPHN|nr:hemolysin family protein [Parasphingorhabdus sp. SCSIO 66989]WOE75208.1 hemolysin family protein [Parasphingorhabdus sp. SCSIO 66989]